MTVYGVSILPCGALLRSAKTEHQSRMAPSKISSAHWGRSSDIRILPLLKSLWTTVAGDAPSEIRIGAGGATVTLKSGKRTLDVVGLLQEIEDALEFGGRVIWLLFDKVDEIFPSEPEERRAAIEGLMTACMSIRRQFPAIQPKILLRTDIWRDLNFTNKSHLSDKKVELKWTRNQLALFLLKRACAVETVRLHVETAVPALQGATVESLSPEDVETGVLSIFPETLYPGQREAQFVDWLVARVTDAQGTILPRETIMLGNQAKAEQEKSRGLPETGLLSRSMSSQHLVTSPKSG